MAGSDTGILGSSHGRVDGEDSGLDRKSGTPLYQQLAKHIKHQITAGSYADGAQLPTGPALAERYQVSDIVVRHALANLVTEGFLFRERGRGTFVQPGARHKEDAQAEQIIKTHRLGLVMHWGPDGLFSPLVPAIERKCAEAGFHLVLANNDGNARTEHMRMQGLLDHGVDGIFWLALDTGVRSAMVRKVLNSVPVVIGIDREVVAEGVRVSLIEADNFGGMQRLVTNLVNKGHRKIAFVREPHVTTSIEERLQGYRKALRDCGIVATGDWIFTSDRRFQENGRVCAEQILASAYSFDAVCCDTDTTAIGVMDFFREKGVVVPDDIAVSGFNDNPEAALVHPKLTTVHMNVMEMGQQAADLMLKQLNRLAAGQPAEPAHVTVPVKLVMRESA